MLDVRNDPLKFVQIAFPWGEPGALAQYRGPDKWQRETLLWIGEQCKRNAFDGRKPVAPIRLAISSGHGVGKSTLVAWLVHWIMSTRPNSVGTITANTFSQLETKTWAQIRYWGSLSITKPWFKISAQSMLALGNPASWRVSAQTCREENSEAFAGQHSAAGTSFYIFDEASSIPDGIWQVAEGGLTDGEPMIFAFGNPTRSSGKFHRVCFGSERERWSQKCVDSRDSSITNKVQIAEWINDYGEDSDFVRVRVRGLPPAASDLQFIDSMRVYEAQRREVHVLPDEPLLAGLDIARGGNDNNVIRFRRGMDARSIPAIIVRGEDARDAMKIISVAAEALTRLYNGRKVHTMFCDETGVGGAYVDRLRQLGFKNVVGVNFARTAPDVHFANMRAYMWAKMREWLERGCIDKSAVLEVELSSPGYRHDIKDRLLLESKEDMKKRGVASGDEADALALTFAAAVVAKRRPLESFLSNVSQSGPDTWMGN